ncbi:hypothetical protein [Acetobacter persici]|uniref:hypothetical protein n=1 Tax=Acetobacter persici TaxID=1076596 RepID=UPI0012FD22EA|nr:hypothetical protein [Acetobacter persici]
MDRDARFSVACGVLEQPAGQMENRSQFDVVYHYDAGLVRFGSAEEITRMIPSIKGETSNIDIHQWMMRPVWRGPVNASDIPSGVLVGQVIAERCAMPCPPGNEAFLIFGLLSSSSPLATPKMVRGETFTFRGADCYTVYPSPCEAIPKGETPKAIFEVPQWGWGEEPKGFLSTMPLEAQELMDRANQLRAKRHLSANEVQEFEEIRIATDNAVLRVGEHPEYDRYCRLMREVSGDEAWLPMSQPRTGKQISDIELRSAAIVRHMEREPDDIIALNYILSELHPPANKPEKAIHLGMTP